MRKSYVFVLVVFLGFLLTSPAAAGPTVLKMTHFLPKGTLDMVAWEAYVKAVNEKGKGVVEIKDVGGPEAIPSMKQFEAVKNGVVDMVFVPESYYGRQVTGVAYTHLSQLAPWEERANGYYDFRVELLKKHNVFYMGRPLYGTWFQFFTNKKVERPQEMKGQKIRVSDTYEAFAKALGCATVTMPGKDVYTALENGTVDGYAWSCLGNIQQGWVEVCKYMLEPRLFQMNVEALMNWKSWEKLPDNAKKLLVEEMKANERQYARVMADLGEKEIVELQKKGQIMIKFTPQDTKWFVDLAYKAQWDEVAKFAPELGPKLRAMLTKK